MIYGVNGYTIVMINCTDGEVKKNGKIIFKGAWWECEEYANTKLNFLKLDFFWIFSS